MTSNEIELVTGTKSREEIVEQLAALSFDSSEALDQILVGDDQPPPSSPNAKSYDYLLNTPLSTFTKEKIAQLVTEAEDRKVTLGELRATTPEEMWLKDLDEFEALLPKKGRGKAKSKAKA